MLIPKTTALRIEFSLEGASMIPQSTTNNSMTLQSENLTKNVRVVRSQMFLLPVATRVPLKFGAETLTSVSCLRVRMTVTGQNGHEAVGWGETPISVQWAWPSSLNYDTRLQSMIRFAQRCSSAWAEFEVSGHPMEVGHDFINLRLSELMVQHNKDAEHADEALPFLAALICASAFDIALHDAYGQIHKVDIYDTYNAQWMNRDLASYLESADRSVDFSGLYPEDFFVKSPPKRLDAWHLVGGLDPLHKSELTGEEPADGVPLFLGEWIRRDGLKRLKIKLRGNDQAWDYDRMVDVGNIAIADGVTATTADFNCMVTDPEYVNDILDRLEREHSAISDLLLYVEQPFPYDLEAHPIDVHSVSRRKPLFLDESAHDWQHVRLGRELGWTGVALKTCKTQTGALLSHCWAKAHGMGIMVQDLTNPMLAQIPHVRLAAYAGTIGGVETNASQFYPAASEVEAKVHPGLYLRRDGAVDLSTISGPGFGYRVDEIDRTLPAESIAP